MAEHRKRYRLGVLASLILVFLFFLLIARYQYLSWRVEEMERQAYTDALRIDALEQAHYIPGAQGVTREELNSINETLARLELLERKLEYQQSINTDDLTRKKKR